MLIVSANNAAGGPNGARPTEVLESAWTGIATPASPPRNNTNNGQAAAAHAPQAHSPKQAGKGRDKGQPRQPVKDRADVVVSPSAGGGGPQTEEKTGKAPRARRPRGPKDRKGEGEQGAQGGRPEGGRPEGGRPEGGKPAPERSVPAPAAPERGGERKPREQGNGGHREQSNGVPREQGSGGGGRGRGGGARRSNGGRGGGRGGQQQQPQAVA